MSESRQMVAVPAEPAGDPELLERIRRGDRAAAETLVDRHYKAVYASLYRLCHGDRELASDLTQETFRKAWEHLGQFDGRAQLSTWLYRIAYTSFLNAVRRPRPVVALDEAPPLKDPAVSADQSLGEAQEREKVRSAVLQLPETLRFVVTAHFWAELSVREIAAIEKITTVAVRKRLAKAFRTIQSSLGEQPS